MQEHGANRTRGTQQESKRQEQETGRKEEQEVQRQEQAAEENVMQEHVMLTGSKERNKKASGKSEKPEEDVKGKAKSRRKPHLGRAIGALSWKATLGTASPSGQRHSVLQEHRGLALRDLCFYSCRLFWLLSSEDSRKSVEHCHPGLARRFLVQDYGPRPSFVHPHRLFWLLSFGDSRKNVRHCEPLSGGSSASSFKSTGENAGAIFLCLFWKSESHDMPETSRFHANKSVLAAFGYWDCGIYALFPCPPPK